MAEPSKCPPLTAESIRTAHSRIKQYIHRTPVLTCRTLDRIASTPRKNEAKAPKIRLFFKCENYQKIGAFKARGAHHALLHLIDALGIDELRRRGVITHSSGNHAQALALAAYTFKVPSYIIMPTISTPSKIAGTQHYTPNVIFSGSTSVEREAKVEEVMKRTGSILVPPYDHPDIILGAGTTGLELEEQVHNMLRHENDKGRIPCSEAYRAPSSYSSTTAPPPAPHLHAVVAPIGGGGLLGGIATYFTPPPPSPSSFPPTIKPSSSPPSPLSSHQHKKKKKTYIFGAEPTFQNADDVSRALSSPSRQRIPHVSTLTIADGLRTPCGLLNWGIVSDPAKVENVYGVSETQIKRAMKLVLERMKVVVEPSGAVGLAVVLFSEGWRGWVRGRQEKERGGGVVGDEEEEGVWNVGVVLSGGNTTVEAIAGLFGEGWDEQEDGGGGGGGEGVGERAEGQVGLDGRTDAEDIAG